MHDACTPNIKIFYLNIKKNINTTDFEMVFPSNVTPVGAALFDMDA